MKDITRYITIQVKLTMPDHYNNKDIDTAVCELDYHIKSIDDEVIVAETVPVDVIDAIYL